MYSILLHQLYSLIVNRRNNPKVFTKINKHLLCFSHINILKGRFTPINKIRDYRSMFRVVTTEEGHCNHIVCKLNKVATVMMTLVFV